jgi:hypothetical protein
VIVLAGKPPVQQLPVLLAFPLPKRGGGQNSNLLKGIEHEEILITSDDRRAPAGHGGREDEIIIAVAARRRLQDGWGDQCEGLREEPNSRSHVRVALAELPREDLAQLVEER